MTFSHLKIQKVSISNMEDLKLLILVLLPFGGFLVHFDLTGLNQSNYARPKLGWSMKFREILFISRNFVIFFQEIWLPL
jgi:hypothetical protein